MPRASSLDGARSRERLRGPGVRPVGVVVPGPDVAADFRTGLGLFGAQIQRDDPLGLGGNRQYRRQDDGAGYPHARRIIHRATMGSSADPMLTINEIFHSIQGESTHSGRPVRVRAPDRLRPALLLVRHAVRVPRRTQGVDRRRRVAGQRRTDAGWSRSPAASRCLQRDVYPLMSALLERGHEVMIETGGHISVAQVPEQVVRIIDVKCPGQR